VDSRPLGRTGVSVSEFIFGAGSIGGIGSSPVTRDHGLSPAEGFARLDEARDLGITVIDTADAYGGGESERTVGRWLAERRAAGTLVCTKVGGVIRPDGDRRHERVRAGPGLAADAPAGHRADHLPQ
jgi:1-deoxyxylulose-5-phosphate synthase